MFILIGHRGTKHIGPIVRTKVLNCQECGVAAVGISLTGDLCYRNKKQLFSRTDVKQVIFHCSIVHRDRVEQTKTEAEFDIYLNDGRVIEVSTCERAVIQAAIRCAPVVDIRMRSRAARGL